MSNVSSQNHIVHVDPDVVISVGVAAMMIVPIARATAVAGDRTQTTEGEGGGGGSIFVTSSVLTETRLFQLKVQRNLTIIVVLLTLMLSLLIIGIIKILFT